MKLVAGAILLHAAEQAYAHAHLVDFPHYRTVSPILLPVSAVLGIVGLVLLIWGVVVECKR